MSNVLLIYTTLIPSVRFCALGTLMYLEENNKLDLVYKQSYKVTKKDLNKCDVLVLVRCGDDVEREIAEKCKEAGKKLVYVLDDDLFNVPESIEGHEYYSLSSIKRNREEIMKCCDVLWSPSPNIIKKYGNLFKKTVLIDEPFVGNIKNKTFDNEVVRIGFAGTETHRAFINEFMGDVLKIIKNTYKEKVSIEFFGFKPDFIKEIEGTYIPYCDNYEQYCSIMRERNWDIGLAPLEQSEFASCKYFNKYIEYSSYGIAGVYSAVEPYTFAIKNGVNGLLAENTVNSWVDAIEIFVNDKTLIENVSENAQRELKGKFTVKNIAQMIYDEEIFKSKSTPSNIHYKGRSFVLSKIKIYTQMYGMMMSVMVIKKVVKKLRGRLS